MTRLFREAGAAIVPISEEIAHTSVIAFERYGKGRNRAALNIADCLSYACPKVHGARLLFKGGDFSAHRHCQVLMAAVGPQSLPRREICRPVRIKTANQAASDLKAEILAAKLARKFKVLSLLK